MDKTTYEKAVALCKKEIPGFAVRFKNETFTSKVIAVLVFVFNRHYMTRFTTTRYPKVYFPSRKWLEENYGRAIKVLFHELVHLYDRKQQGIRFNVRYSIPQLLALLSLLAFFSYLWTPAIWGLCALVFLLPWPSRGRRDIERRGYAMSMAVNFWRHGEIRSTTIDWILKHFTGWNYYKMWWFSGHMRSLLEKDAESIRDGSIIMAPASKPYAAVYALLESEGLLKK